MSFQKTQNCNTRLNHTNTNKNTHQSHNKGLFEIQNEILKTDLNLTCLVSSPFQLNSLCRHPPAPMMFPLPLPLPSWWGLAWLGSGVLWGRGFIFAIHRLFFLHFCIVPFVLPPLPQPPHQLGGVTHISCKPAHPLPQDPRKMAESV